MQQTTAQLLSANPGMVAIQPAAVVQFGAGDFISLPVFAPDSASFYLTTSTRDLNAWAMLVWYWPEILGGVVALAGLVLLIVIVRVSRSPRVAGRLYCRACGYEVGRGVAVARCSECGTESAARRPVRGRGRLRRLAPALIVFLIFGAGYGALHASGVGRDNSLSTWLWWTSAALRERLGVDLVKPTKWDRFIQERNFVYQVESASGRVLRGLASLPRGRVHGGGDPKISPDGSTLVFAYDNAIGGSLVWVIDCASARHRTVWLKGVGSGYLTAGAPIGISTDSRLAYFTRRDGEDSVLFALDLATFAERELARERAGVPNRGRRDTDARRGWMSQDGSRILLTPSFAASYDGLDDKVSVFDVAGGVLSVQPVAWPRKYCLSEPAVSASGDSWYVSGGTRYWFERWRDGATKPDIFKTPKDGSPYGNKSGLQLEQSGISVHQSSWIALSAPWTNGVVVMDLSTGRYIAHLPLLPKQVAPRTAFSPDGRWLAVTAFLDNPGLRGIYTHRVTLFDLSVLHGAPAPTTAPASGTAP